MSGGEDFTGGSFAQNPFERIIARAPEISRYACPIQVHVDGERGRRSAVREPTLLLSDSGECHSEAPKLTRHRKLQIARRAEVLEVFMKEAILSIVDGCALAEAEQGLVRQDWLACAGGRRRNECRHDK